VCARVCAGMARLMLPEARQALEPHQGTIVCTAMGPAREGGGGDVSPLLHLVVGLGLQAAFLWQLKKCPPQVRKSYIYLVLVLLYDRVGGSVRVTVRVHVIDRDKLRFGSLVSRYQRWRSSSRFDVRTRNYSQMCQAGGVT